jgi:predicted transcriptional regulator of viral defense system
MMESPYPSRTLGEREGAVVAWLEAERRAVVSGQEVADTFAWTPAAIRDVLSRLERKGWLRRTARGRYETVLAATGGFAPPNPWAALSTWRQPYYVAFQSAAYEHGLTPDRAAVVQVAVPVGAKAPKAWREVPIALIALRAFSDEGVDDRERHGVTIRLASPERILVDGAALPHRVGGPLGLARIASRSVDTADWDRVVGLATKRPGGAAALRRLATILDLLDIKVPAPLARAAAAAAGASYLYLGERRLYGARGSRLARWAVVDNVGVETLREEIRR